MHTTAIKYENFFPEKVYHCLCLKNALDEIFENDIRNYSEIILAVTECCQGNSDLYCLRVQEKTNCLFLYYAHMMKTLISEAKFDCTSTD